MQKRWKGSGRKRLVKLVKLRIKVYDVADGLVAEQFVRSRVGRGGKCRVDKDTFVVRTSGRDSWSDRGISWCWFLCQ